MIFEKGPHGFAKGPVEKQPYDCVYFVLCSRRFSYHESSARPTFGIFCQRPIEMVECGIADPRRPMSSGDVEVELKISYREG